MHQIAGWPAETCSWAAATSPRATGSGEVWDEDTGNEWAVDGPRAEEKAKPTGEKAIWSNLCLDFFALRSRLDYSDRASLYIALRKQRMDSLVEPGKRKRKGKQKR